MTKYEKYKTYKLKIIHIQVLIYKFDCYNIRKCIKIFADCVCLCAGDKTLMQSLVFDAMVTHDIQRAPTSTLKEDKQ